MTSDDRRRMRERLQTALATAVVPDVAVPPARTLAQPETEDLIARFTAELEALAGTVRRASGVAEMAAAIIDIAAEHKARMLLAWDEEQLGLGTRDWGLGTGGAGTRDRGLGPGKSGLGTGDSEPGAGAAQPGTDGLGLYQRLVAAGLDLVAQDIVRPTDERNQRLEQVGSAALGLTGADAAIAETGSIVIGSGPGRGRLASLLPLVHVAIVRTTTIVPTFGDLIVLRPDLIARGSNLVCIAGPSRTADIEKTLSRGVHGPKHVYVVLI